MEYYRAFDVLEAGYRHWTFPAFGLLFVAIGGVIILWQRLDPSPDRSRFATVFPYLLTGFALAWILVTFIGTYTDYRRLCHALRTGNYDLIEGVVTDFVPMPYGGHAYESFVVSGHRYEYSDFEVQAGFNNTSSNGGPVRNGVRVRIADVGGQIARLEIAR